MFIGVPTVNLEMAPVPTRGRILGATWSVNQHIWPRFKVLAQCDILLADAKAEFGDRVGLLARNCTPPQRRVRIEIINREISLLVALILIGG
jgi:hypothetical protein